jgi:scyllo-inositol 2-dehydrogenase (NADP+)
MTVDTALIGFGLAGASFHAPLIAAEPRLRLRKVVSSRRDAIAAALPDATVMSDAGDVMTDDGVQLVVIASPNETHAALARDALLAGKHVVVDKPFATSATEARDLIRIARERGRMLTVFHNRRWDGDFLTVQRLVEDGQLGEVRLAMLQWDRFRPAIKQGWRELPGEGSGLLADFGPHLVDQAVMLFGTPDHVAGDIARQRATALVDDYFQMVLFYGATRVILSASTLVAAPRPRFALHGTEASFVKFGIDPQEATLRAGGHPGVSGYGKDDREYHGVLTRADGSQQRVATERGDWPSFYTFVADALIENGPVPVAPVDALTGMAIIDCARRSAREGRLQRFVAA